MAPSPPKFALKFLRWFCRKDYLEEIEGDLIELFELQHTKSPTTAKRKFTWSVVRYFRPEFMKAFKGQHSNHIIMQQHNLKLTYRTFLRYKSSFFINLIGLATGLTCAILIFLWVMDELSIDKFHANDSRIYQVMLNHEEEGQLRTGPATPGLLAEALQQEVPEIQMAVEDSDPDWFGENFSLSISNGGKFFKASGKFAGANYFQFFSFDLKHGDPATVLSDKNSIVISEPLADKLFGTTEGVVGKTLQWQLLQYKIEATITGVFNDVPANSTLQFDFVLPFSFFKDMLGEGLHWNNFNVLTYVELAPGTNIKALNKKVTGFIKHKKEDSNVSPFLVKFSDLYLHGTYENGKPVGGRILYVKLFSIVGIFVLVIACINFMNLSTARASRRLKEIGVKKAFGAGRGNLVVQHISEALLMAMLALVLALVLVYILLPQFNAITGKVLILKLTPKFLLHIGSIIFFTGLLAGSYPALYLSGFKPVNIFKGKFNHSSGEAWTRKGLVVFQFVLSIILVACVFIVYKQIDYALNKNLGYDKDSLIRIPVEGKAANNIESFITGLKQVPGVVNVTATSHTFVKNGAYTTGVSWPGKSEDVILKFEQAHVYYDIIETLGMHMKEGRSFSRAYGDEQSKIIFNEAAIKAMGLKDPVGTTVRMWGEDKEIIGMVKDFNYASLHKEVEPMLFHFDTTSLPNIMIKIDSRHTRASLNNLTSWYREYNTGYAFDYVFLDKSYAAQYQAEERVSDLSRYFAGMAIIISCLGLFGLAAFTAERRQKEIGIRKILGASHRSIIALLSGDFTKMVIIAIVIGLPISYWATTLWLQEFAYRIDLCWWYFAVAGLSALIIAWLTVGIQIFKASTINPVQSLKDE